MTLAFVGEVSTHASSSFTIARMREELSDTVDMRGPCEAPGGPMSADVAQPAR